MEDTSNRTDSSDVVNASVLLVRYPNETSIIEEMDRFQFVLNKVIVPILFGLISFVGTIGNSLVIYVILSNHTMRTVTNLLLLNLAVADLSFVLVVPPSTAYLYAAASWPFGNIPCKLLHYMVNVTAYVTVYTLVLISAIRFMTIVRNVETAAVRTRRNVVLMVIGIWVVMLILNAPILSSYGLHVRDGVEDCDNYGQDTARRIFATFFVFAYLLPLAVIGILSVGILRHIGRHKAASMLHGTAGKKKKKDNRKKQASTLLIIVVVLFAILWLPVHIHLLVAFFGNPPESALYGALSVLCYCLAYFNSCVNPIIYNRTSKEFRDAFRQAVCCCAASSTRMEEDEEEERERERVRAARGQNNHLLTSGTECTPENTAPLVVQADTSHESGGIQIH